jgi:hypothetical protein
MLHVEALNLVALACCIHAALEARPLLPGQLLWSNGAKPRRPCSIGYTPVLSLAATMTHVNTRHLHEA